MVEDIRNKELEQKRKTMKDVMARVHFERVIALRTLLLKYILRRRRNRTEIRLNKVEVAIQMYSSYPPIQNNDTVKTLYIENISRIPRSSSAFPFRQFHFTDKHLSQIVSNHL